MSDCGHDGWVKGCPDCERGHALATEAMEASRDYHLAFRIDHLGEWPRCLYNGDLFCGEPETRAVNAGPTDVEIVRRGWHVADMCDCPSCPLRVAIRHLIGTEVSDA